jgi:hypothetical protein
MSGVIAQGVQVSSLPAVSGSDNLHHSLYLFRSGDAIQSPTLKEIPLVVIYSMEFEGRIVSRDHH